MTYQSVLIVDDESGIYDYLDQQLARQNVHLMYAHNGLEAIDAAEQIMPDLILLDVMMPDMDGFETCQRLPANPTLADVPIVMITALDDSESHLRGFKVGVDDFFTKPVNQVLLLTRVQNILQMNRYRRQVEERAHFTKELETKNSQLRHLTQNLIEVQEKERRFIAAELHDDLGQLLTGLKLMIEMASSQAGEDQRATLSQARAVVSDLSVRIRNLSLDLRPAMLDDFGLFSALEWLFERYTTQTRVKINHNINFMDRRRFPQPVETAAFRVIQESLTNVARYAGVSELSVNVDARQTLEIIISDAGAGFDSHIIGKRGRATTGLSSMRERVDLLGGKFTLTSRPGHGTRVKAVFSLQGEGKNVHD
jgi:signal transduction histidine kinase